MRLTTLLLPFLFATLLAGCASTTSQSAQQVERSQAAQVEIGYAHLKRGKYQEAKAAFGRALNIDPDSAGGHYGMARIYEIEQDYDRAEAEYKEALSLDDQAQYHHSFGAFYYNRGEYQAAYRQFERAAEDDFYNRRAMVFQSMGYAAWQLENLDQAVQDLKRARALDATLWSSAYAIAAIEFNRGNIAAALQEVLELDRLDRADLVEPTAQTLWLQIRVAHAADEHSLRDAWRIRLKREFSRSPLMDDLQAWEQEQGLS